jgi:hypothetical protein
MNNEYEVEKAYRKFFDNHGFPNRRMISGSRSSYMSNHAGHEIIFNACVATQKSGPVWHGDLDLTLDYPQLKCVAKELCESLYILTEQDSWRNLTPASITECAVKVIDCND